MHYLYRKPRNWAIAGLVVVSLSAMATAQIRDRTEHKRLDEDQQQTQAQNKKPSKRGPRAIAVIEFLPQGGARLVPIALWMDGKYYDASFYGANPEPMALQPETLYEAMHYGEPTGWFTVTKPEQVNGNWVADGKWRAETAFDVMQAHQAAKQAKQQKPRSPMDDDSGPPVLRRAAGSGSSETSQSNQGGGTQPPSGNSNGSASNAPQSAGDDSERPTLKDSSPSSSSTSASDDSGRPTLKNSSPSASSSTDSSDSSNRPTLKNSSPSSSSTTSASPTLGSETDQANAQAPTTPPAPPASSPDENDPDRPTLHRGKPKAETTTSASATPAPKTTAGKTSPASTASPSQKTPSASSPQLTPQPGHAYPAISDAGVYETRSLMYPMTQAEKEERGRPMLALALEEVRSYHQKRRQALAAPKTAVKTAAKPENFAVSDYDLRAFDLDFSNSPTLVLTAKVAAPNAKPAAGGEFDYFVTVVARVDISGQAQKVFSSVTDNNHLDAFPRLEIIDAVDADANGRGDLLFRQHSDSGISYALYRVYPYQMVKVFEGGAGM